MPSVSKPTVFRLRSERVRGGSTEESAPPRVASSAGALRLELRGGRPTGPTDGAGVASGSMYQQPLAFTCVAGAAQRRACGPAAPGGVPSSASMWSTYHAPGAFFSVEGASSEEDGSEAAAAGVSTQWSTYQAPCALREEGGAGVANRGGGGTVRAGVRDGPSEASSASRKARRGRLSTRILIDTALFAPPAASAGAGSTTGDGCWATLSPSVVDGPPLGRHRRRGFGNAVSSKVKARAVVTRPEPVREATAARRRRGCCCKSLVPLVLAPAADCVLTSEALPGTCLRRAKSFMKASMTLLESSASSVGLTAGGARAAATGAAPLSAASSSGLTYSLKSRLECLPRDAARRIWGG
mmetsp:Transcript_34856/g.90482  ORF Transcript_34856/g.90482 Transcript_34856/m.90482 type:complete len:355 (-) Transcript_34856:45-1109(-)